MLWKRGNLSWLLNPATQKPVYDFFHSRVSRHTVMSVHRRGGKSYLGCVLACETALRHPGSVIHYVGPT
ncbi:MAG: hypothetical protein MN733_22925, partial [Nitrososphaera sp.]|nr:hypothetical protein [Nitrososphaera sp.]